jgi:hypothetical protein
LWRSADMKTYSDQQLYSKILKSFLENNYSQYQSPKKD